MQGRSLLPLFKNADAEWRKSVYYAYYELGEHRVPQHFGVRTDRHKLIYFPNSDEWNLFDLVKDPQEMVSVHANPEYESVRKSMTAEYNRLRKHFDAPSYAEYAPKPRKK